MQIPIKIRETLTGATTVKSPGIDVSGMPLAAINLTVHTTGGTVSTFTVQFQTSGNLEDWTNVGPAVSQTTAGVALDEINVKDDKYGRYVRAVVAMTGTDPLINYSLWLDTYPSS